MEELGISLLHAEFIGEFTDIAAGQHDVVKIFLYRAEVSGIPVPQSEIESAFWVEKSTSRPLSPVLKNKIIPYLIENFILMTFF